MNDIGNLADRTIRDFGEQWTRYVQNEGYYGSVELLRDICAPLVDPADLQGCRIADIGAGTGRITTMLLAAGAAHVVAVEPSAAFDVLERHTVATRDRVTLLNCTGDRLPAGLELDWVISIGVVHHIPEPRPALRAAYEALKPGGRLLIWVYAQEGNGGYLRIVKPLRRMTTRLPHVVLASMSRVLAACVSAYLRVARPLRINVGSYLESTFARLSPVNRRLVVYDQLRPAYAKYYRAVEVYALLTETGFESIQLHHRHGYSWSALACKP